jgi:hypothetical protein
MREREHQRAIVSVAAIFVAAVLAIFVPPSTARAWGGGSWSGSAPPFNGGTISGDLTLNSASPTITTGTNKDLSVAPNGSGSINLKSGSGTIYLNAAQTNYITGLNGSPQQMLFNNVGGTWVVVGSACTASSLCAGYGSSTHQIVFAGNGMMLASSGASQAATCASGTVSVDPVSPVITIDSNAATCTATIATTTMTALATEGLVVRITAKNVGASTLKIASTNFATIPTRCSSTGLTAGQSLQMAWSKDQAKWVFLGGCE